jgi:PmbA protein
MSQLPTSLDEFIDSHKYQETVRDILAIARSLGADAAEVGLVSSMGLTVTVRKGEVDTLEFDRHKTMGITVYSAQRKGSASTSDLHPESLRSTIDAALHLASLTEADPYAGLAEPQEMAKDQRDLQLYHPWAITVEQAIALAKDCEKSAFALDNRIKNSEGATISTGQTYRVYGNSHGFLGAYPSTRHSLSCAVIAEDGKGGMERDYDYTVSRRADQLALPEEIGKLAAEHAVKRLYAKKISTQKVPVLFHSKVASSLWGHFLTAISGGRLFRKTSFMQDSLGKIYFPEHIDLFEEPHLLGELGSATFDDDGVATSNKHFVKAGRVENYLLSAYSARKLGMKNTGNAGGVHNLSVSHGKDSLDDLVKKMHRGLIVTELMGQGVNLVTGDYSRGATGFWVENGEIQHPVHEITVAGHLKDLFKHCVAVGKDVDKRHSVQTGSVLLEEMMVGGGGE